MTKTTTNALWKILWEMSFYMRLFLLSVSWSCVAVPWIMVWESMNVCKRVWLWLAPQPVCGIFLQNPSLQLLVLCCQLGSWLTQWVSSIHLHSSCSVKVDPESQSVATGTDATFRVEASGYNLQFQWQKDERNIIDDESRFKVSKTKDSSALCIHRVQKSDKGHYRCLIKNPVEKRGKASQEANLTVCKFLILLCAI